MLNRLFNTILLCFLILSLTAQGQNSAVTNAILYHKDGEIARAKQEIDQAVVHEKTIGTAKAWYHRGVIYLDIANSTNPQIKGLSGEALDIAFEAFSKAIELDPKGEYQKMSASRLDEIWAAFINQGYYEYDESRYEKAISSFEKAIKIKPADTTGYIYASYAAEELERYDLVKGYMNKLSAQGYKSPYMYQMLIHVTGNIEKDREKGLSICRQALSNFPGNLAIMEVQTDLFIAAGKRQEAIDNLLVMHKAKPKEASIMIRLAVLYDQLKQTKEALDYYDRVLALDSEDFIANFNISVIYYNQGKAANDKLHRSHTAHTLHSEEAKKDQAEIDKIFVKALNHASKAVNKCTDANDREHLTVLISELNKALGK